MIYLNIVDFIYFHQVAARYATGTSPEIAARYAADTYA